MVLFDIVVEAFYLSYDDRNYLVFKDACTAAFMQAMPCDQAARHGVTKIVVQAGVTANIGKHYRQVFFIGIV